MTCIQPMVTACEGCVDWNSAIDLMLFLNSVTACEGCVDWNRHKVLSGWADRRSQPARAVWIEILLLGLSLPSPLCHSLRGLCGLKSTELEYRIAVVPVTACEGCVDWNNQSLGKSTHPGRHSLRGLCGLKSFNLHYLGDRVSHSLRGLCGLKYETFFI